MDKRKFKGKLKLTEQQTLIYNLSEADLSKHETLKEQFIDDAFSFLYAKEVESLNQDISYLNTLNRKEG
jgi:hypothetical protein